MYASAVPGKKKVTGHKDSGRREVPPAASRAGRAGNFVGKPDGCSSKARQPVSAGKLVEEGGIEADTLRPPNRQSCQG